MSVLFIGILLHGLLLTSATEQTAKIHRHLLVYTHIDTIYMYVHSGTPNKRPIVVVVTVDRPAVCYTRGPRDANASARCAHENRRRLKHVVVVVRMPWRNVTYLDACLCVHRVFVAAAAAYVLLHAARWPDASLFMYWCWAHLFAVFCGSGVFDEMQLGKMSVSCQTVSYIYGIHRTELLYY